MTIDVAAYLARIGWQGPLAPDAATLAALQEAHLQTVPFENLDIARGRPLSLDEGALFDKIVRRRRGGFCYELNGLFSGLLRALGYPVTLLAARVTTESGGLGPEFDHLALLVPLETRYLVDVGFGQSSRRPLRLDERSPQFDGRRAYRVVPPAAGGVDWVLEEQDREGVWRLQYVFTLGPRRIEDFFDMCGYHQTSPESPFTRRRFCTRATPDGRVTVTNNRLLISANGARSERELAGEAEIRAALREHFGVELD